MDRVSVAELNTHASIVVKFDFGVPCPLCLTSVVPPLAE
jgi:hypothetical protein